MANKTIPAIQTNEGNVGIGVTSPSQKLHVDGNVLSSYNILTSLVKISSASDAASYISVDGYIAGLSYAGTYIGLASLAGFGVSANLYIGGGFPIIPAGWSGTISGVAYANAVSLATSVLLQTSPDGSTWTTRSQTVATSGTETLTYSVSNSATPLYVRFTLLQSSGVAGISATDCSIQNIIITNLPSLPNKSSISNRFLVDGVGNVGIGSTTPGAKLDVVGNVNIDGPSFYRIANDSTITAPSDHGLVAYYGFDEGSGLLISDKTGRNNTSALGLTYTTTAIRGTALDGFGGNANYVVVPDSTDFDFGTGDFAVSLWCRPNSSFTGVNNTLIEIGLYTAGILIRPQANLNTIEVYAQGALITEPTIVWATNVWYHIVVTRVSSVLNVYSNGTRISSVANSSNIQVASAGYIGRSAHAVGQFFYGIIDEVKIYKGKGLDYGEVRGQYLSRGDSTLVAPIFSNTNGYVGIGTTSLGNPLEVYGTSMDPSLTPSAASIFNVNSLGVELAVGRMVTSPFSLWLQGKHATVSGSLTYPIVLNPLGGNVGIGLTNPAFKLHVTGTNGDEVQLGTIGSNQIVGGRDGGSFGIATKASSNGNFILAANSAMYFRTNTSNESAYIASNGNFGINTTNPTKRLHVKGGLYWNLNDTNADEHVVAITRGVAAAAGSFTEIGALAASANSIRATIEIFHHNCGTIEYSMFELIANYYTGATTDWVQLPSRTQAHYAGEPNGVVVDARLAATGGAVDLRFRSLGGACGAMAVYARIRANTVLTETTATGTGATVAGLLGFNRYEFPVTDSRFKGTYDGLFIKNNGFIGIGSTNPQSKLSISGTNTAIALSFGNTVANNPLILSTYSGWAGIGMDQSTAGLRLVGDYSSATTPLIDVGSYIGGAVSHANWKSSLKVLNNSQVSIGGVTPLSLLAIGGAGSTTAVSGITFGNDAQANLYRSAEDTIKTDGSLNVAGLIYNSNSAYYSSVTKTAAANWGQYSIILGNSSYASQTVKVLVNGGNISWAGSFLVSSNISYRPNEIWCSAKLQEFAVYGCSPDDVTLLVLSDNPITGFGGVSLVLKTNGAVNNGLGTGLANTITVTVNGPSPSAVSLSNFWVQPYTYQIATSANTKQIYTSENGTVGIGTYSPASAKLESYTSANSITFNHLATNLNNASPIPVYAFDVTNGIGETRSIKAAIGYERHLSNGRGTLHFYNRTTDGTSNIGGTRSSAGDIKVSIANDGNVGINTTIPGAKLDVVGAARISDNILSHKTASYTTSYPGINSFGGETTDSGITYYDTGKTVPNTSFRGVVWTGKHYIFTSLTSNLAYFYDNNFNLITNSYGFNSVSLPLPSGYASPHGAAWDGRYLWVVCSVSGETTASKIVGYDLDSPSGNAAIIAESAPLTNITAAYDIEYADGHFYIVRSGNVYIYRWNGSTIDLINTIVGEAGTITAQAITYDGSYLWVTQNGQPVYKLGLDGYQEASITSGFPPDTCGWAWNGSNIVSFDFFARNIYIINTKRLRIDTQNLALMGGRVGIGSTAPTALLNIRASAPASVGSTTAGTNLLIDSSTNNYITFRNSADNGTYAGLVFLDNNVGGYVAFGNAGAAVGSDSMIYGTYQDHIFQNNYVNETLYNRPETMRIKQNGRVGIGTNTPTTLLSVGGLGSSTAASGITFGGDAEVNLYRIGENILKTDGNFQIVGSLELRDILYHYSNIRFLNKAGSNWLTWFTRDTSESEAVARLDYIRSINTTTAGNLGIGTTLPSGKLHVVSSVSNDTLLRADGTNGTLFSVVDDLSDSLMSVNNSAGLPVLEVFANDRVVMGQYGANDFVLTNNKIGLGTNNPQFELDIVGAGTNAAVNVITRMRSTAGSDVFNTASVLAFTNTTTNSSAYSYIGGRIDAASAGDNAQALVFGTNATNTSPTEKMRISSAGNVGIGITNPVYKLQVAGQTFLNNGTSNALQIQTTVADGNTRDGIYLYENDGQANGRQSVSWYNGNQNYYKARLWTEVGSSYTATVFGIDVADDARNVATRLAIRNGNVGIGITVPTAKLSLNKGAKSQFAALDIANNDKKYAIYVDQDNNDSSSFSVWDNTSSQTAIRYFPDSNGYWQLYTNNVERVRINNVGNVGINQTSPTSKLHIVETTQTGVKIQFGTVTSSAIMNAGQVNHHIALFAPFNANPASVSNNGAKWGIIMHGSIGNINADIAGKAAAIYAVSEEDVGGGGAGAGYNRKVGLALHTSAFDAANTERVRINNLGDVGIGITNPAYRLVVSGGDMSIASANILRFGAVSVLNTSSNANDIYANIRVIRNESTVNTDGMYVNYNSNGTTAAHLRFYANGTSERMRIQANDGFVGIGTATAVGRLDVYDDINAGHVSFVRNANTGSSAYTAIVLRRNGDTNGLVMFTNSSNRLTDGGVANSTIRTDNGKLLLGAGASTYHSLETNGNVGIGVTNPNAARLHIKGDTTNPVIRVETNLIEGPVGGTAGRTLRGWLPIMTGANAGDKVYIPLYGPLN